MSNQIYRNKYDVYVPELKNNVYNFTTWQVISKLTDTVLTHWNNLVDEMPLDLSYEPSTGVFTVLRPGAFEITPQILWGISSGLTDRYVWIEWDQSPLVDKKHGLVIAPEAHTLNTTLQTSECLSLSAGDTFKIMCRQSGETITNVEGTIPGQFVTELLISRYS